MKFHNLYKDKINYILVAILAFICIYLSIRFLLPILLPFIIGFFLSKLIIPIVNFLNKKLNFHRTTANIIVICIFIIFVVSLSLLLITKITSQISNFVKNWGVYETSIDDLLKNCCYFIEDFTGISGKTIYINITKEFSTAIDSASQKAMPVLMDYSIATIRGFFDIFLFILIVIISLFFFSRDNKKINDFLLSCRFKKEIIFVRRITKNVILAYIKTQFIIILLISIVCAIGLTILKNPYSILYGMIIGILDFLPLVGAGTFLIPLSIYYCLKGDFFAATVLFILFIICYLIREILEPKLMGGTMGIHPLVSLISIFTGYKLFGLLGMILGPFAYVFISEILKCYDTLITKQEQ